MPERFPYGWFKCGCYIWPFTYPAPTYCRNCGQDYERIEEPEDGKAGPIQQAKAPEASV